MPFKANNTPLPRAFSKDAPSGGKARPNDELVEVTGYDIPRAVMYAKRISNGRDLEIHINADKAARARESAAARAVEIKEGKRQPSATLNGALIDADMQKKMPVGSWAALESAVFQRRIKEGGNERLVLEASWIDKSESNTPEKAIQGVFTVEAYGSNVQRVQHWHDHIDCMQDEEALKKLAERLNQEYQAYDPEVFIPRSGVQFVAVLKTDKTRQVYNPETNKRDKTIGVGRVIDMSPRYDRHYDGSEQDREFRPLDGKSMLDNLNGYIDYLEQRFPEQASKGDITVEVAPYTSYYVIPKYIDNSFVLDPSLSWKRINKMANTLAPQAIQMGDEEEPLYKGGNMAVRGILLLLGDRMVNDPVSGTPSIVKQYACKRLLTNGYFGPVHTLFHAADGRALEMDERLMPVNTKEQEQRQGPAQSGQPASRAAQAGASSMEGFVDDANPFAPPSASDYGAIVDKGSPPQEDAAPATGIRARRR